MSDQGRWFKLWVSALNDTDLDNLSISDFGRWAKLGTFIKEQGKDGIIHLSPPAKTLCSKLQIGSYEEAILCIASLPNVRVDRKVLDAVTGVTDATVTFLNWKKFQGDNSLERVRNFRNRVTPKKRREEKREDLKVLRTSNNGLLVEKEKKENAGADGSKTVNRRTPLSDEEFMKMLEINPAYKHLDIQNELHKMKAWCEVNRREPNHRRFVNWLNKADKPVADPDYSKVDL